MIEANLELCRVPEDRRDIYSVEAGEFLRQTTLPPWDIVYFDPPYKQDYVKTLEYLGANSAKILTDDGLLIVEHHHKNALPENVGNLRRIRVLKQGDSALSFYAAG